MKTIPIPHTNLKVSQLCLGCMDLAGRFQKVALSAEHEAQARAFLDTAEEIGANFFDHANIYAHGRAEEVFGRILRERPSLRDRIVLQSKAGIRWTDNPPGTPMRYDFSKEHLIEAVEGSLKRLSTDHLDILLLHRPDPLWEAEEIARAFETLKRAGKVRHFGVSNQNRFQMEHLQRHLPEPLVVNQLEMNLLHHGFAEAHITFNQRSPRYPDGWEGVLEYCKDQGVLLQAWRPLAQGYLSGRSLEGQPEVVAKTAKKVAELSEKHKVNREAIVIAWLLRHPSGIQPVLGTIRPERLRACAQALEVELSRVEWYELFAAARGEQMP
ncbi:MAG TPA: aldo/keto reductase [Anaeromyxobacter sp.]|nr:aldo/keto reductase [Anaeromyxobacter sp.]